MGKVCWDFPLLGTGNQSGSNIAAITMFKGSGIMDGLAREVCQNSLDAKDKDLPKDTPVKVCFKLSTIKKSNFRMFDGYSEALESAISYWQESPLRTPKIIEFLNNVKTALDNDEIPMLTMSDYNTVGLNGVHASQTEKSFWNLLVNTEGISIKQDDNSAGSFGIGKNAPFAYSALNLVFYNTLAKDGGRAFEGVTRLVTTRRVINGKKYLTQPIGKYLYFENEYDWRPILPNDTCPIAYIDAFKREKLGTDVAVVGFKLNDYSDWEKLTALAVIKNFILSIMKGKLEVSIQSPLCNYEISKNTLDDLLYSTFKDEPQLKYTRQTYETISKGKEVITKIAENNDLSIFVKYEDTYSASLSRFRSTGMLINTTTDVLPHFSVVIVVNDVGEMELSKTLREAEPPQHNEWKAKNITDNRALHNKAAKFIRSINSEIQKVLDDFEQTDITDKMDAGIGSYLPDSSDVGYASEGSDGLKTDVKISEIKSYDGRLFYDSQYESASTNQGAKTIKTGIKTGNKKHKKKNKKIIPVVNPKRGNDRGVSSGTGKVKVTSLLLSDHRTYYLAANKYRCYINSPKNYEKVFIKFFASREDDKQDALLIKNIKIENCSRFDVYNETFGPFSLREGDNTLYVEFENSEIMAVIPVFTMEVKNE